MLKPKSNYLSLLSFILVAISILYTNKHFSVYNWLGTLTYDVAGYYYYLPALFLDNLADPVNNQAIQNSYDPNWGDWYITFDLPNGNQCMKYTLGTSLAYLPAFGIGHWWAKFSNTYAADGFSLPYQAAVHWWCAFIALVGLWFCRINLLRLVSDAAAAITLFVIAIASNYFMFATWASPMTHCIVFTYYALLIYLVPMWYEKPTFIKSIAIGLLMGLVFLTRPPEIIFTVFILAWGVASWQDIINRLLFFQRWWLQVSATVVAFVAMASLQFIYWKYVSGEWFVYSYQDQTFDFLKVHLWSGLFSAKKGWLVYTPVMLLALAGFYFLYKTNRKVFWPALLFTLINVWVVFSWQIWWYSGGPGQRSMIQSYAVLAIPMAFFLQAALNFRMVYKVLLLVFIAACAWVNLTMSFGEYLVAEEMNSTYLFEVLGKVKVDPIERRLIDNRVNIPFYVEDDLKQVAVPETSLSIEEGQSFATALSIPLPENSRWVRVEGLIKFEDKTKDHLIHLNLFNDDAQVASELIQPARFLMGKDSTQFIIEAFTGNNAACNVALLNISSPGMKGKSSIRSVKVSVSDNKKLLDFSRR